MVSLLRRVIYYPAVNSLIRGCLRPFRQFLPSALKIPVSGVIRVDTEGHGPIRLATNQTSYLTKEVYWGGLKGYEYDSLTIFIELVGKAGCFLDVGANIGYYSIIAAQVNPDITVYAFEAMPGAHHYLKRNIALNGFSSRIRAVEMAVSDEAGDIEFHVSRNRKALHLPHQLGGSSSTAREKDHYSRTIRVKCGALDEFVREESVGNIDIMKIDTEGTEDRVLRGAGNVIESFHPIVVSEVLPGHIEDEVETFFRSHGYRCYLPEKRAFCEVDTLRGHDRKQDFFFIHPSRREWAERFLGSSDAAR